jgi:hypothetical protein
VLAIGTSYRQDIGTLWLPLFLVILWQHRFRRAIGAALLFTMLNMTWIAAMLADNGGWSRFRAASAEYAYQCGYLNSIWNLGFIDAPVRYSVKLGMALIWTLGPALLLVPRGVMRLAQIRDGAFLGVALGITAVPALSSHLLVQFGSAGWCFHYVPGLMILVAMGVGRSVLPGRTSRSSSSMPAGTFFDRAPAQLGAAAAVLAALFWFYPTDYQQPGWRGSFELAFCRFTRTGLKTPIPNRSPAYWRTANSRPLAGTPLRRPAAARADSG